MRSPAFERRARARGVRIDDEALVVELTDGRTITVPIDWFLRLAKASPEARQSWVLLGNGEGIHWPDADEDLSTTGLLAGHAAR